MANLRPKGMLQGFRIASHCSEMEVTCSPTIPQVCRSVLQNTENYTYHGIQLIFGYRPFKFHTVLENNMGLDPFSNSGLTFSYPRD